MLPALKLARQQSLLCFVVQRILNVEYSFPPQIKASEECRDLLERILVANPAQRMGIPQIMQHPWSVLLCCCCPSCDLPHVKSSKPMCLPCQLHAQLCACIQPIAKMREGQTIAVVCHSGSFTMHIHALTAGRRALPADLSLQICMCQVICMAHFWFIQCIQTGGWNNMLQCSICIIFHCLHTLSKPL